MPQVGILNIFGIKKQKRPSIQSIPPKKGIKNFTEVDKGNKDSMLRVCDVIFDGNAK
jgi:hypothetical protein